MPIKPIQLQNGIYAEIGSDSNLLKACEHGVKTQLVDRALNGRGIRDTARVLKVSKNTVMPMLKKASSILTVNPHFQVRDPQNAPAVRVERVCDEAELDEQWSYVGKKSNQRWLWYAVDHATHTVFDAMIPMTGVLTNAIWMPHNTKSANAIRKKWNAKTSI